MIKYSLGKLCIAILCCSSVFLCNTSALAMQRQPQRKMKKPQASIYPQKFDVIVCGGGTAGVVAATAAGRYGASVLIVEQLGSLGGTQSNAWVTPMMPNHLGPFKLDRGINLEILAAQSELQPGNKELPHGDVWYDPTMLSYVQDQLTLQAGVQTLFNATLIDVHEEDGHINSVKVATRQGHLIIEGKTFIDTTGDAQLSFYAGAELMGGDEEGQHQPMTLRFTMGDIDLDKLCSEIPKMWNTIGKGYLSSGYHNIEEDSPLFPFVKKAVEEGVLKEDDLGYFQVFTMVGRPHELAFNCPKVFGFDPLDAFELSKAYQAGREKIVRLAEFMQQYMPGCENAYISVIAPLMGIRESRRVVGEYILTMDDHLEQRKFEDVVARNRYPIDIHRKRGTDYRGYPKDAWHDIPYGSIVVKGFDNLWVAGRCISADFITQSAIRIQSVCRSLGQAAGTAAAICAKNEIKAKELPYKALARHLDFSLPPELKSPEEAPNSSKHD